MEDSQASLMEGDLSQYSSDLATVLGAIGTNPTYPAADEEAGLETGSDTGTDADADLRCPGLEHDFRAVHAVPVLKGKDPARDGADAFAPPCPRCGCRHTALRGWKDPKWECPAAIVAKQTKATTKVADPARWPQSVVCMHCPLCGVNTDEPRPCPTGPSCAGHTLGDFVCLHPREAGGTAEACAQCMRAGKTRPCPCDICRCARVKLQQHPLRWFVHSHTGAKQRATRGRDDARLHAMMPSIAQNLNARGVSSAHVQASVARAIVRGGGDRLLPNPLYDLLSPPLVDESSHSADAAGKCAQPCACARVHAAVELMLRARRAHGARAGGYLGLQDSSTALPAMQSDGHDTSALPSSPFLPVYAPPALAFSTPPPSTMRPGAPSTARASSTSPTLTRTVSGLQGLMERDPWRMAMLIALNPGHTKYSILRSTVDFLADNKENMAAIVDALVREPQLRARERASV